MKPNTQLKSNIFDRVGERTSVQNFILNKNQSILLVEGESGSGKSAIIQTVLNNCLPPSESMFFSFAENYDGTIPFSSWISKSYDKFRINNKVRLKDIRINIPFIGTSAGFEVRDEELTACYFENFIRRAKINNIKLIWLSNIELCSRGERDQVEYLLKAAGSEKIKIIVEQGTLPNGQKWLSNNHSYVDRILNVSAFNKAETEKLFFHIHNVPPPTEIFSQSGGNSLCVKHYGTVNISEPRLEWAQSLIREQSGHDRSLLRLACVLGTKFDLQRLKSFYQDHIKLCSSIERLVHNGILKSTEFGYEFSHPIFTSFLSTKYLGEVESEHLNHLLKQFLRTNKKSFANLCIAYALSEKMNKSDIKTELAKRLLPVALSKQNYLLALKLTGSLIEKYGNLTQLLLLRIQLLVQIGDVKSANLCFKYLTNSIPSTYEEETNILRAFVLYGLDKFEQAITCVRKVCANSKNARLACIAWGSASSNAIALGDDEAAKEYFNEAYRLAQEIDDKDLMMDCGRIAARVLPFNLAYPFIRESIALNPTASVSKAKLVHTFGTLKLLENGRNSGLREIEQAQAIFEVQGLALSSHSYIAIGLNHILNGNYNNAIDTLLDGLNVAFESLDRFAILSNVAFANALNNDFQSTLKYAKLAFNQAGGTKQKHQDKIIENAKWHNLSLAYFLAGESKKAQISVSHVSIQPISRWPKQFNARSNRLKTAIENNDKKFPLIHESTFEQDWFVNRYNWIPMLLSFYGFKVDVFNSKGMSNFLPA